MSFITADIFTNAGVHTITIKNKDYFWVEMKAIHDKTGLKNIPQQVRSELCRKFETNDLSEKHKQRYTKPKYQIIKVETKNKRDKYAKNDITEKIIKNCRGVKKCNNGMNKMQKNKNKTQDFRTLLGSKDHDIFKSKESSIIDKIQTVFSVEKLLLQQSVFTYRIDVYFLEHMLAVEIDEAGHQNRDINYEIQRQKAIEEELGCKFIRINPDKEDFDIFIEIGRIQNHIIKSNKEIVIDDISDRLLSLEFKKITQ